MRIFYWGICLLAFLGNFGCQSSSQSNKHPSSTLKINVGSEPQTLDPRRVRDLNCVTIARMLFEGLARINKNEQAELALADSMEVSSDLCTYTFHLKKSKWSNGDPVTAHDFVYAWKKALSPDFPTDTVFHLYMVKNAREAKKGQVRIEEVGVRAIDEQTLQVELESPTPYFLELLSFPAFFPISQKVDEKNPHWAQSAESYVCNGPFLMREWRHHDQIVVERNTQYWDAEHVNLAQLQMVMVNEDTGLRMFEKRELDWAGSPLSLLPFDALKSLKKRDVLKAKNMLGTGFIRINTERAPFNQLAMRKAFALAVRRQEIVEHALEGYPLPATSFVPPSMGLQKTAYFPDGDVSEAQKLFREGLNASHLTKTEMPEVTLMYVNNERNRLIAQTVQQQWYEAFGIRVKLEVLEGKVYYDRLSKQDYQLACGSWSADFADPINFLEIFKYKNGGSNNTSWENSRYIELLDRSSHTFSAQERRDLLRQSEEILIEEMPIIPIFYFTMLYLNQPYLKDVVLSPLGIIDFRWASMDYSEKGLIAGGEQK